MSTSLPHIDNYSVSHHKIPFGDSLEIGNDPPPNYYKDSYEFGAEECIVVSTSSTLSQSTQYLVDALGSILDASFEKDQLIESLETALRQQPAAKYKQIFDIAQSIFHACRNVYKPKGDSSTINHEERHQPIEEKDLDASQSESDTEDIAAKFHTQRHQSISAKGQLELQESAQALKLSQANSSKKVLRSKATSSNVKTLPISRGRNTKRTSTPFVMSPMTCDTTSRESSRLSSPEIMGTPPRIEDALQKETPKVPKGPDYALRSLIDQSTEEFIYHTHQQIIEFSSCEDPSPAYKDLLRSLYSEESEGESTWSSGSKWLILAETGQTDRKVGAIICALAAMELQKWHASQMLQHKDLPLQSASKLVTDRLVGPRPADYYKKRAWIQRRSNIATLLTRGKKWIQLVEHLGLGILFKDAWKLAKTPNINLPFLIEKLENDQAKMTVLHILSKQIKYLIKEGKTKEKEFEEQLQNASLGVSSQFPTNSIPRTKCTELDNLYQEISNSVTSGRLAVRNAQSPCEFDVVALHTLTGRTWLIDKLVVACLHLSDKLPFVRVGWCIPIHQDIQPEIPIQQPFERASLSIKSWRKQAGQSQLVYFFPLNQHGNHFTLLEINEREGYIYHYNSMREKSKDVENACKNEFPNLQFSEKEGIQQKDGNSCGLMVIKHAQNRMVGLPANFLDGTSIDSTSLRCKATSLLREAWNQDVLVEAQIRPKRERRMEVEEPSKKIRIQERDHLEEELDLRRTRRKRVINTSRF